MADKTNPDGQKIKGALEEFAQVDLCWRKTQLQETPTKKRNLVHMGM